MSLSILRSINPCLLRITPAILYVLVPQVMGRCTLATNSEHWHRHFEQARERGKLQLQRTISKLRSEREAREKKRALRVLREAKRVVVRVDSTTDQALRPGKLDVGTQVAYRTETRGVQVNVRPSVVDKSFQVNLEEEESGEVHSASAPVVSEAASRFIDPITQLSEHQRQEAAQQKRRHHEKREALEHSAFSWGIRQLGALEPAHFSPQLVLDFIKRWQQDPSFRQRKVDDYRAAFGLALE